MASQGSPAVRSGRLSFRILGVAGLFVVVAGLYFGKEFLVPLAVSVLFAFILSPAVGLLQRTGLARTMSVVVGVVVAFGLLGGVGYFIIGQVASLAAKFPEYRENIESKLKVLNVPLSKATEKLQGAVREVQKGAQPPAPTPDGKEPVKVEVVDRGPDAVKVVTGVLGPLVHFIGTSAVVILLVIFLLLYENDIRERLIRLAGGEDRVTLATQTLGDAVHGVSRFLFLQAIVNVSHGVAFGLGLFALGVPNALLWGFTAAVLRFIPYLGPVVAALLPVILSIAIFPGWGRPLLIGAFIGALELVSNNVIEPWVYGKRTGLSPFAIVLAALFWAWLWGPMGLLLSVPLTVCLMTVGKYVPGLGFLAVVLGDEPALDPEVQIYDRLLVGRVAEAAELIERKSEGKPLAAVYDELLIPVLRLADGDFYQGRLDEERMEAVLSSLAEILDDLRDAAGAKAAKPPGGAATVLCLPSSDRADELAASMLADVLLLSGYRAEAAALEKTTGEKVEFAERGKIDVLVISVLPPSTLVKGKYLYKRLRRRLPATPVVVGIWGHRGDLKLLERHLAPDGRAVFATGLAHAQEAVARLAQTLVLKKPAA